MTATINGESIATGWLDAGFRGVSRRDDSLLNTRRFPPAVTGIAIARDGIHVAVQENDTPHVPCTAPICSSFAAAATSGAVQFILYVPGTFVISGWGRGEEVVYYVKASLLVVVYFMLGGSNRDYYRVHVFTHTALTPTAILTLTLGAATARERALRPTVTVTTTTTTTTPPPPPLLPLHRSPPTGVFDSLPFFYLYALIFFFFFFYLLFGICHFYLVTVARLSRSV